MNIFKKITGAVVAIALVLTTIFTVSAFKSKSAKRAPVYFKYAGSSFDETAYRNISNWQHTTAPEEEGCIGDSDICILSVDSENLTAPGSMLDKLDYFFNTDLNSTGQVESYVDNPANREAEQN